MQVVDARLLEVVEVFPHALQGAVPLFALTAEGLDVHEHAEQVPPLVPVRLRQTLFVELFERGFAFVVVVLQHGDEVVIGFFVIIELHVEPFQLVFRGGEALCPGGGHRLCRPRHRRPHRPRRPGGLLPGNTEMNQKAGKV